MNLRLLRTDEAGPGAVLRQLERTAEGADETVLAQVRAILEDVRQRGDAALVEYTRRFDGVALAPGAIAVTDDEWEEAERAVLPDVIEALRYAARRIEEFHEWQRPSSWFVHDEHGSMTSRSAHDGRKARRLVEGGNDDQVIAHDSTPESAGRRTSATRQPPRAIPCTSTGPIPREASSAAAPTRRAPSPPC